MEIESQVELLDSDLVAIRELFHRLNVKYSTRRDTKENLLSLVREAEDGFRKLGFEISVCMSKQIAYAMGVPATPDMPDFITFSIDRRIEPEFDFERMAWEAKRDLIPDGVAKKFLAQGGTQDQTERIEVQMDAPEREDEG